MKKIIILFTLITTVSYNLFAQTLLLENFDSGTIPVGWSIVDYDGDEHCWHISTTQNYPHPENTFITSESYLPNGAFAGEALTPDNWMITPAIEISSGTHLSFSVNGQNPAFPVEIYSIYVASTNSIDSFLSTTAIFTDTATAFWTQRDIDLSNYAGQNIYIAFRHYNSSDQSSLNLDDIIVFAQPTNPLIESHVGELTFEKVVAGKHSEPRSIQIFGYNLTDSIQITTTLPFEVSTDNINYNSTATLSVDGGNLFVRYSPTVGGLDTGAITLSTIGAETLAIPVNGSCIECTTITDFPFFENFEPTSPSLLCWEIVDANEDGENIAGRFSYQESLDDHQVSATYFYSETTPANDWLISPKLSISADMHASFEYVTNGIYGPEIFSVFIIPEGSSYEEANQIMPNILTSTTVWKTLHIDLRDYANQTIQIAIKVESPAHAYYISFDNFVVQQNPSASIQISCDTLSFIAATEIASEPQIVFVEGWSLPEGITLTTSSPFEISFDGASFSQSLTIPGGNILQYDIQVRFYASTAGNNTGILYISSDTVHRNVILKGTALDCSEALGLPFYEDFEDALTDCWQNLDSDGDKNLWKTTSRTSLSSHSGSSAYFSESYNYFMGPLKPNNWLITPKIAIPNNGATLKWWIAADDATVYAEHYEILVSTTGTDFSDFTSLFEETLTSNDWKECSLPLNDYAGQDVYFAFVHNDCTDLRALIIDDISVTSAVNTQEFEQNLSIYPNPVSENIHISTSTPIHKVTIYNMEGQLVYTLKANANYLTLPMPALSNGIYILRIDTESGVINRKITLSK